MNHFGKEIETESKAEDTSYIGDYAGHSIVFLDVDGVLNCAGTKARIDGYIGLQENKIPFLAQIVDFLHADIVLISSWKADWYREKKERQDEFANALDDELSRYGLKIVDKTNNAGGRGSGIARWITIHGPIKSFVILDDERHDFKAAGISRHWVQTSWAPNGGLNESHVQRVKNYPALWAVRKDV